MVSQLFSPSQPKNLSDIVIVLVLALHIGLVSLVPKHVRPSVAAVLFLFWRGCYNLGLGYLLQLQSQNRTLVSFAKQSGIFNPLESGQNPHPSLYRVLKREMETKIQQNYSFDEAPLEYNTWVLFRRLVDLILMCDFVCYCLYAIVCGGRPAGETLTLTILRWLAGLIFFFINLWVKLDAHRVVKDYAWYWGDFFFLTDQKLTFDGVFEMAPHPMYSIGYAGFYGFSLMAASYRVLAISIIAHAAQFAFLLWVENPHIDKTYNTPSRPRKQVLDEELKEKWHDPLSDGMTRPGVLLDSPHAVHKIIGIQNVDLYRVTDTSVILLQIYVFALTAMTPTNRTVQALFVAHAVIWRLWYSVGIGYLLSRQSTKKRWTRHFLKYGEGIGEAWHQWKGTYHIAMTMCYATFIAAVWKMYSFPSDWDHGLAILKHVVGAALICLQIWTSFSIYQSLGEFGWFFGDFFLDQTPKLTYNGIYRFLNNPERFLGLAGVWGATLITWNPVIFCLALLSQVLALAFIELVERPHMNKLYGQTLRPESGLTKGLKKSLPPHLWQWHGSVDRMMEGTLDSLEDFLDAARPKLAASVNHFVKDTTSFFKQPTRIMISRLAPHLAGYDPKDYSIRIEKNRPDDTSSWNIGKERRTKPEARSGSKTVTIDYGAPIKVRWTAPLNHSKKDWIGLYMVADNCSRDVTQVASQGRWIATNKNQYHIDHADQGILISDVSASGSTRADGETSDYLSGEVEFSGKKLWWGTGVFEFRYHHDGKYNVMATSTPFEISINKFDEDNVEVGPDGTLRTTVEKILSQLIWNCFDRDPKLAPSTAEESFRSVIMSDSVYARRVVFAVNQL